MFNLENLENKGKKITSTQGLVYSIHISVIQNYVLNTLLGQNINLQDHFDGSMHAQMISAGHWANPQLFTFKHIFVTTVLYILVTVSLVLIPRSRMPGPKNCMFFFQITFHQFCQQCESLTALPAFSWIVEYINNSYKLFLLALL